LRPSLPLFDALEKQNMVVSRYVWRSWL
jgi:hypothetical protein